MDMTGRTVYTKFAEIAMVEINIENLPAGQYIVEASHNAGISRNLIIKR